MAELQAVYQSGKSHMLHLSYWHSWQQWLLTKSANRVASFIFAFLKQTSSVHTWLQNQSFVCLSQKCTFS